MVLCPPNAAADRVPKHDPEVIVIVTNDWTSQIVLSHVLKNIYDRQGYPARLKSLETAEQWGFLSRGRAHVQVEVWEGTMAKMLKRLVDSGEVVVAGTHDATTREDWWYPNYVEGLCPGLPDWRALKNCAHVFSTPSTGKKGRYLGGPWEKPDKARVRALDLDFVIERVKKGSDLWVALENAYSEKRPIILFNWTPNWVEAKYEGKFVEFPPHDPRCETDASWGVSNKWKFDCGNPKTGWLKKLAWKGMPRKWPCAYQILERFNLSNKMIADASAYVHVERMSHKKAAAAWMTENADVWRTWIPKHCKAR